MSRQPSKKEFEVMKIKKEEKRRFFEENGRAVREIERRKCLEKDHELEKEWNVNWRQHKRQLSDAKEFIERDEVKRIKVLVERVMKEEVDDDDLVDSVVAVINEENYSVDPN